MRQVPAKKLSLAAILVVAQFFGSLAMAAVPATCKVETNDVGTIVGKGRTKDDAFVDAATQCFERRQRLYSMSKGHDVDEESGIAMIDLCANIRCGS